MIIDDSVSLDTNIMTLIVDIETPIAGHDLSTLIVALSNFGQFLVDKMILPGLLILHDLQYMHQDSDDFLLSDPMKEVSLQRFCYFSSIAEQLLYQAACKCSHIEP